MSHAPRSPSARPVVRHRRPGLAAGAEQGHRAHREPRRRRHSCDPGVARRRRAAVYRVAARELRRLAPDAAGDADLDALREYGAGPSRQAAGRRAHAADLLQRADRRRRRSSRSRAATSCSARTSAATSSRSSIATTWPTAASRCSPTAAARRTAAPSWSTKGDRLAYGSTRRNGADRDLYVMNPADPKTDKLVMQVTGGGWQAIDWSPDDSRLLVVEFASITKSTLWVVDAANGQKTALTNPAEEVSYGAGVFSADGRGVYVTTDKDSEFQRLGYIDLATKQLTPLATDIKWDVEGFDLSQDGKTLALRRSTKPASRSSICSTRRRARPAARHRRAERRARRAGVAPQQSRAGILDSQRALDVGRLLARRDDRRGHALDRERARRPGRLGPVGAGADPLEELRRAGDFRLLLQGAGALYREASGDHQHPRRPRGPVAAVVHRAQQLLPQRAGRLDHLSQRARLGRLRQDLRRPRQRHEARGLGQGHRRAARLDCHAAGARCRRG